MMNSLQHSLVIDPLHPMKMPHAFIAQEIEKDVAAIKFEDPETTSYYREVLYDLKWSTYHFLIWAHTFLHPMNILYPAAGFDRIPKLAFGKVIHTSLEQFGKDKRRYCDDLDCGEVTIADNASLPFPDESFQLILLLDSPFEFIGEQRDEIIRVLKPNGIVILSRNVFMDDMERDRVAHYLQSGRLHLLTLPKNLQQQGPAGLEFFALRKTAKGGEK